MPALPGEDESAKGPIGGDVGVEGGGGSVELQFSFGQDADHGGVVGTEGFFGEPEFEAGIGATFGETLAERGIAGDAA